MKERKGGFHEDDWPWLFSKVGQDALNEYKAVHESRIRDMIRHADSFEGVRNNVVGSFIADMHDLFFQRTGTQPDDFNYHMDFGDKCDFASHFLKKLGLPRESQTVLNWSGRYPHIPVMPLHDIRAHADPNLANLYNNTLASDTVRGQRRRTIAENVSQHWLYQPGYPGHNRALAHYQNLASSSTGGKRMNKKNTRKRKSRKSAKKNKRSRPRL